MVPMISGLSLVKIIPKVISQVATLANPCILDQMIFGPHTRLPNWVVRDRTIKDSYYAIKIIMKSFAQNLLHKVKDSTSQNPLGQDPASRTHTAAQLAEHAFAYFYSPQHHQFEAKVKS